MKLNSTRQKRKLLVYIIGVVLLVSWVVSITLLLPSSYKNDTSAGASISDAHAASFSLYKSARSNDCRQVAPSGATCIYPVNRGLTNGRYYMYECVDGWCWFNYPCLRIYSRSRCGPDEFVGDIRVINYPGDVIGIRLECCKIGN